MAKYALDAHKSWVAAKAKEREIKLAAKKQKAESKIMKKKAKLEKLERQDDRKEKHDKKEENKFSKIEEQLKELQSLLKALYPDKSSIPSIGLLETLRKSEDFKDVSGIVLTSAVKNHLDSLDRKSVHINLSSSSSSEEETKTNELSNILLGASIREEESVKIDFSGSDSEDS